MRAARRLVNLEKRLRRDNVDLFGSTAREALASDAEAAQLVRDLEPGYGDAAPRVVQLALQALRVQHTNLSDRLIDASFVATLPGSLPSGVLPTRQIVMDMLRDAKSEVIALGYEITEERMVEKLDAIRRAGLSVHLIFDRTRAEENKSIEALPFHLRQCVLVDAKQEDGAAYAKMHSKALLVDGEDLLITSANFTFHGLNGNIELGVRLKGPPAAQARQTLEFLMTSGYLTSAVC